MIWICQCFAPTMLFYKYNTYCKYKRYLILTC